VRYYADWPFPSGWHGKEHLRCHNGGVFVIEQSVSSAYLRGHVKWLLDSGFRPAPMKADGEKFRYFRYTDTSNETVSIIPNRRGYIIRHKFVIKGWKMFHEYWQ